MPTGQNPLHVGKAPEALPQAIVVLELEVVVLVVVVLLELDVVGVVVVLLDVVVGGSVVVVVLEVVVGATQGFGEHVPGPAFVPPSMAHSPGASTKHPATELSSKAPIGDAPWQHWIASTQPFAVQASQQLDATLAHACPFFCGVQVGPRWMLHFVTPFAFVRQQVSRSERPHRETAAHLMTWWRQSRESVPKVRATRSTHIV